MTGPKFDPEDPRLTAYVMGELSESERLEVERLLEDSPEARAAVNDLGDVAARLERDLNPAPAPRLSDTMRAAILAAAHTAEMTTTPPAGSATPEPSAQPAAQPASATPDPARPQPATFRPARLAADSVSETPSNGGGGRAAVLATVASVVALLLMVMVTAPHRSGTVADSSLPDRTIERPTVGGPYGGSALASVRNTLATERGGMDVLDGTPNTVVSRDKSGWGIANGGLAGGGGGLGGGFFEGVNVAGGLGPGTRLGESLDGPIRLHDNVTNDHVTEFESIVRDGSAAAPYFHYNGLLVRYATVPHAMPRPNDVERDWGRWSVETPVTNWAYVPNRQLPASGRPLPDSSESFVSDFDQDGIAESETKFVDRYAVPNVAYNFQEESSRSLFGRAQTTETLARTNLGLALEANRRVQRLAQLEQGLVAQRANAKDPAERETLVEKERQLQRERTALQRVERQLVEVQRAQLGVVAGRQIGVVAGRPVVAQNIAPRQELVVDNAFVSPVHEPVSKFTLNPATNSYEVTRDCVANGTVPPPKAVQIEEFLNWFDYTPVPQQGREAVAVNLEAGPCPWNKEHRLVRVALEGRRVEDEDRPPLNLVFLVDVSRNGENSAELPLVQHGLRQLNRKLGAKDRLAIVANNDQNPQFLVESAQGNEAALVEKAVEDLETVQTSNGVLGFKSAFGNSSTNFVKAGLNGVVLCTDDLFDVDPEQRKSLERLAETNGDRGLPLTVLKFGSNGPRDVFFKQLAQRGGGTFLRVDNERRADKVFTQQLVAPPVAENVELSVEFNPGRVRSYRLLGYENPPPADGELLSSIKPPETIRAGQRVIALYELATLTPDTERDEPPANELRYQRRVPARKDPSARESLVVKVRYEDALLNGRTVEREVPLVDDPKRSNSTDFGWTAAVAAYGLVLRDSPLKGRADLDLVEELAEASKGPDPHGERREFLETVYRTKRALDVTKTAPAPVRLSAREARRKATVDGKYAGLLETIERPEDHATYSSFKEWGWWAGTEYAGRKNLPPAFWVYAYPHWYLWGEDTTAPATGQRPAVDPAATESAAPGSGR